MIPPIFSEQSKKIDVLENSTFQHIKNYVAIDLVMQLRDLFLAQHTFFWELADSVAQVAVGRWIWSDTAWRHWEPPHHWLGYKKL